MAAVREAWAVFQRRYCRMESPAVFLCAKLCENPLDAGSLKEDDDGSHTRITAFVCETAEKPPKAKTAAAAMAEPGYVRESLMTWIPVVISRTPERNSRTGAGIMGVL